ncbi:hypothetical protein BMS3Abin07_01416 [bacterium BMS3Abin07]|nr:hypothetical protein BMS3Abin07_01416 [bacterium BMS3Abin07]GBE33112.1 hypothetical protein BMS3Bbin05_02049 [bacterium BMS3Bbin05]
MLKVELSQEEVQALRESLECYLSELRMEIANTDRMDFREDLKKKKEFLRSVVQKLL